MKRLFLFVILLTCCPFGPLSVIADELRTYQSTATAPVLDNDMAYAKHNAFIEAQYRIITTAIQDLLDPGVYEESQNQIQRRSALKPGNHLLFIKIINEFSEDNQYSIELQARIQIRTLKEELRKMGLVLKSDPWIPITLLVEAGIPADIDFLKTRLDPYHIKIDRQERINLTGITETEKREKVFLEDLFLNYPTHKIIYLLEMVATESAPEGSHQPSSASADSDGQWAAKVPERIIEGVRLRIIRKSDLEELNTFSLRLPVALPESSPDLRSSLAEIMPRLFSLLTLNSIKRGIYDSGLSASYYLDVTGLNAPYLRSVFERQVLEQQRSIISYALIRLSADTCRYVINSNSEQDTLVRGLIQPNPYFELAVEKTEFMTVVLSAFYHFTATGTAPENWEIDPQVLKWIRDALMPPVVDMVEETEEDAELNGYYIPTLIESETNNSIVEFNTIPEQTYLIGEISSRADEDIFELTGKEISEDQLELALFPDSFSDSTQDTDPLISANTDAAAAASFEKRSRKEAPQPPPDAQSLINTGDDVTVYIDWILVGKTSLSPQLTLYDGSFNFINAFHLVRSQKRLRFNHTFRHSVPEKLYVRISDKIGFIQGETGGFKRYLYLLKYSWSDDRDEEPVSPIVETEQPAAAEPIQSKW